MDWTGERAAAQPLHQILADRSAGEVYHMYHHGDSDHRPSSTAETGAPPPPPRHLLQPQRKHGERERKREPSDGHRESGAAPPTRLRQPGYPRRRPHIGGGNPLPLSRRVRPENPGNHPIFRTFSFSGLFPIPGVMTLQTSRNFQEFDAHSRQVQPPMSHGHSNFFIVE